MIDFNVRWSRRRGGYRPSHQNIAVGFPELAGRNNESYFLVHSTLRKREQLVIRYPPADSEGGILTQVKDKIAFLQMIWNNVETQNRDILI